MTSSVYPPIPRSRADLSHLPGEDGLPIIGQTVEVLARPTMLPQRLWQRYGAVSRGNAMFENCVHLLGPDANRFVLADRDRNFSADGGWQPLLGRLFPRGLMLRDGADHRKLMQFAFKKKALPEDLASMQPMIRASIDAWPTKLKFYPAMKRLTLDIAAQVFLGLSLGRGAQRINTAFVNVVAASMAVVRTTLPGTRFGAGLRGRRQLEDFFAREIASRRCAATSDLFSRLCQAESDDGERFSDDEIVDHMIFVMMAAHDTTTSSLSSICYLLAVHPEWQARVRAELQAVPEPLAYERLAELPLTGYVLREALRLYPPLPSMRRRTVRDCEFDGHRLPADTTVNIFTHFPHHMPEYWHEPASFDPERFARNEHRRHPFQFIPFGAGAHTCIGMHFAELQVRPCCTCCSIVTG